MTESHMVSLGAGLYSDPDEENVLILDVREALEEQKVDVTRENAFAVWTQAVSEAAKDGKAIVLVDDPDIPSVTELEEMLSNDPAESEPDEPAEDDPLAGKSHYVDAEGNIHTHDYVGPDRRRLPR